MREGRPSRLGPHLSPLPAARGNRSSAHRLGSASAPSPSAQPARRCDDRHIHSPRGQRALRRLLAAAAAVAREHLQTSVARAALLPRALHGAERRLPVRRPWGGGRRPAGTREGTLGVSGAGEALP